MFPKKAKAVDFNSDYWRSRGAKEVSIPEKKEQKATEGGAGASSSGAGDKTDWLPWVSAGGSALLAHAIASSLFDDDKEKNKSVWYRLLKTLFPVGAGALGAYGGYRLADSIKTAADKRGIEVTIGDRRYMFPADQADTFKATDEWGRREGYPLTTDMAQIARDKGDSDARWGKGMDLAGTGSKYGLGGWNAYNLVRRMLPTDTAYWDQKYTQEQIEQAKGVMKAQENKPLTPEEARMLAEYRKAVAEKQYIPADKRNIVTQLAQIKSRTDDINGILDDAIMRGIKPGSPEYKALVDEQKRLLNMYNNKFIAQDVPSEEVLNGYRARESELAARDQPKPSPKAYEEAVEIVKNQGAKKFRPRKYVGGVWRSGAPRNVAGLLATYFGGDWLNSKGKELLNDASKARTLADSLTPPAANTR